jgi:phage N-6-adenine-methyltransferase
MATSHYYTSHSSNGEWYTPADVIARAVAAFGRGIDLDPYSSDAAQATVKAARYFTSETDGLLSAWPVVDTVWANPPYGKALIEPCINRVVTEFEQNTFQRGIVLVNNATETEWFQRLLRVSLCGCMVAKRIRFIDGRTHQTGDGNTRGQVVLYLSRNGAEQWRFVEAWRPIGVCFDVVQNSSEIGQ